MSVYIEQAGRPTSLVATSPAKTITDILDWKIIRDGEIIAHMSGSKRCPLYLLGKKGDAIEISTTDMASNTSFPKGTYCTGVTFLGAGTLVADDASTDNTKVLTATLDKCTQVVDNGPKGDFSGKPAVYTLRFEPSQDPASGTEGSMSVYTWA